MFNFGKRGTVERSNAWVFITMLVFGIIGLVVSFILSTEEIHLMQHPNAALPCSLNAALNCATVMKTWQASVFGFPNMLIGLMAYPIVITVAVVTLAGAKLPRWFWIAAHTCYGLGAIFAYWLFFNSLYIIQTLCPWCLVITFSTTILFSLMTHYNLRENTFQLNKKVNSVVQEYLRKDFGKLITAGWIVLMIALVVLKFGSGLFA